MEMLTGELLNDALVNSPPRAVAVRPSLPLLIVVLLPTTDGSARLFTLISCKASVRGLSLALAAVKVVVVRLKTLPTCLTSLVVFLNDYGCRWILNKRVACSTHILTCILEVTRKI